MRSSWIIQVGPKSSDKCPYKKRRRCRIREHTQWKAMRRQRQRLEGCSHKPRNAWSYQKLEEARKDSPLQPSQGVALLTPWFQTSSLQNCERINLCCFVYVICYSSPRKLIQQLTRIADGGWGWRWRGAGDKGGEECFLAVDFTDTFGIHQERGKGLFTIPINSAIVYLSRKASIMSLSPRRCSLFRLKLVTFSLNLLIQGGLG